MRLDCGNCVLRPWSEDDAPSLVRHANNYEVWRRLRDRFPHPYTQADAEQWIAFAQQQDPQTQFAIEVHGEVAGGMRQLRATERGRGDTQYRNGGRQRVVNEDETSSEFGAAEVTWSSQG